MKKLPLRSIIFFVIPLIILVSSCKKNDDVVPEKVDKKELLSSNVWQITKATQLYPNTLDVTNNYTVEYKNKNYCQTMFFKANNTLYMKSYNVQNDILNTFVNELDWTYNSDNNQIILLYQFEVATIFKINYISSNKMILDQFGISDKDYGEITYQYEFEAITL